MHWNIQSTVEIDNVKRYVKEIQPGIISFNESRKNVQIKGYKSYSSSPAQGRNKKINVCLLVK